MARKKIYPVVFYFCQQIYRCAFVDGKIWYCLEDTAVVMGITDILGLRKRIPVSQRLLKQVYHHHYVGYVTFIDKSAFSQYIEPIMNERHGHFMEWKKYFVDRHKINLNFNFERK